MIFIILILQLIKIFTKQQKFFIIFVIESLI